MVTPYPTTPGDVTGGVESAACTLIDSLSKATDEIQIHVVAPRYRSGSDIEHRSGVTIHWVKTVALPGVLRYWSFERQALHRCLEKINPAVTHFQGAAGWALGYSKPSVLTIHGIPEIEAVHSSKGFGLFRKLLIRQVEQMGRMRFDDKIIINPYVTMIVGENNMRGRLWSIENPVSDDFFTVRRKIEKPTVLFVGRVSELKNVLGLMRAFRESTAKIKDAELRIAGDTKDYAYTQTCMDYAHKYGLNVRFLGNVDRERLTHELSTASCLALVSRQETAPIVIGEAMASGVPVVASNICGIPYMVTEGTTGYLVTPDDIAGIAEKLSLLLTNKKLNTEMGAHAREIALQRFSAKTVAMKTLTVYSAVKGAH